MKIQKLCKNRKLIHNVGGHSMHNKNEKKPNSVVGHIQLM